jgi:hypothetical protein
MEMKEFGNRAFGGISHQAEQKGSVFVPLGIFELDGLSVIRSVLTPWWIFPVVIDAVAVVIVVVSGVVVSGVVVSVSTTTTDLLGYQCGSTVVCQPQDDIRHGRRTYFGGALKEYPFVTRFGALECAGFVSSGWITREWMMCQVKGFPCSGRDSIVIIVIIVIIGSIGSIVIIGSVLFFFIGCCIIVLVDFR